VAALSANSWPSFFAVAAPAVVRAFAISWNSCLELLGLDFGGRFRTPSVSPASGSQVVPGQVQAAELLVQVQSERVEFVVGRARRVGGAAAGRR
jgi:hypothetical protein